MIQCVQVVRWFVFHGCFMTEFEIDSEYRKKSEKAKSHLEDITNKLNAQLLPYGITVSSKNTPSSKMYSANFEQMDGIMYANQIECFGEIFSKLIKKNNKKFEFKSSHACVTSLTQVGKTGLLNLVSISGVLIKLLTGETSFNVRLLIDHEDLEKQTLDEAKNFVEFYGDLIFACNNQILTIKQYYEDFRSNPIYGEKFELDIQDYGVFLRTSPSNKNCFSQLYGACKDKNIHFIVSCDESHARQKTAGTMHQMLSKQHHHWLKQDISFIGVSATNMAFSKAMEELNYPIISLQPGPNYTGLPRDLTTKKIIDISHKLTISSIQYLDSIAKTELSKTKVNICVDFPSFHKKNNKLTVTNARKVFEEINEKFKDDLLKAIVYLLSTTDSNGILIRLLNHNNIVNDICEEFKNKNKDIMFHSYTSLNDSAKRSTLKDFVKTKITNNKKYVIFVTGRGRMGTAIPQDIKCGIDFSNESDLQVMYQGIVGRITGYNKGPNCIVFLTQKNANVINNFIESGNINKSPHRQTMSIASNKWKDLHFDDIPLAPRKIIQNFINKNCEIVENKGALRAQNKSDGKVPEWDKIHHDSVWYPNDVDFNYFDKSIRFRLDYGSHTDDEERPIAVVDSNKRLLILKLPRLEKMDVRLKPSTLYHLDEGCE